MMEKSQTMTGCVKLNEELFLLKIGSQLIQLKNRHEKNSSQLQVSHFYASQSLDNLSPKCIKFDFMLKKFRLLLNYCANSRKQK